MSQESVAKLLFTSRPRNRRIWLRAIEKCASRTDRHAMAPLDAKEREILLALLSKLADSCARFCNTVRQPAAVRFLLERRRLAAASRKLRDRASGVEMAAGWRGDRARHFARQPDALPFHFRVRDRHRRQQRFGVGMQRRGISSRAGAISTMRPRYITAMRSLMCSTTARSWAMKR